MKKISNKKATSIVEAIIVMLVVVTGVVGMYRIYNESMKLSNSTANKIQAIQIASQGIEAFTSIRDTNWILFSSDYTNCWNTFNYNDGCVGDPSFTDKIDDNTSYKIYKDSNKRWELEEKLTGNFTSSGYIDNFEIFHDNDGIYTQSGTTTNEIKPLFTRELKINYLPNGISSDHKIKLTSVVQRVDSSSTKPHKVEIDQILTNWKNFN